MNYIRFDYEFYVPPTVKDIMDRGISIRSRDLEKTCEAISLFDKSNHCYDTNINMNYPRISILDTKTNRQYYITTDYRIIFDKYHVIGVSYTGQGDMVYCEVNIESVRKSVEEIEHFSVDSGL